MPALTISLFSWTRRRLALGQFVRGVCYILHMSFRFIALNTKSASSSTLMRASCFIATNVYDALFFGIGVVSLKDTFIFVVSSSRAFCCACSFCSIVSSSVSIVSSGRKKSCSSSATAVECKLTCIGRIVMSFLTFSSTFFGVEVDPR